MPILWRECSQGDAGLPQVRYTLASQEKETVLRGLTLPASTKHTADDEKGWRATFYTTGMEHSPTSATGTAWERTPWHATRRAASEALDRGNR